MTAHLVVQSATPADADTIRRSAADMLQARHGIAHSTLQFEADACHTGRGHR